MSLKLEEAEPTVQTSVSQTYALRILPFLRVWRCAHVCVHTPTHAHICVIFFGNLLNFYFLYILRKIDLYLFLKVWKTEK